jgi:hypothetical protein
MKQMKTYRVFSVLSALMLMSLLPLAAQDNKAEHTPGHSQTKQKAPEKAGTIQVVDEYDWGTTGPAKLKAEIEIKNVGEGMLNITKVQPSCGCTVLEALEDSSLVPGQAITLHVQLDAVHRKGSLSKSVAIMSDDPNNPTKIIRLRANIQNDVTYTPDNQYLVFNNAVVGKEVEASIRVKNTSEQSLTLYAPEVIEGAELGFQFNLAKDKVLKPGEEFEFKALVTPTSKESIDGKVVIRTSSANNPMREFRLYGTVVEQASTAPTETQDIMIGHKNK